MAFTFTDVHALLTAYKQRKVLGMEPMWCVNHGPTLSIYYRDPNENKIETQIDVFETPAEADAFMTSEEFAENPIGVDFVPEELEKRLASGETLESVLKRERIGERGMAGIPLFA
jgi:hypothetical protein